ncbi:hypothetical protein [Cellulomonas sp. ES6]|uniref:hypothetical protein n=1 Tax=Cellulomonas sp. ES6 TaxID=3039384 RepID=UPI0024B72533|nr:hypothetical protein [Cellulomonas sp. ES6]WHP16562.1 hypothetical protein P9841_13175 [Cellulomonas sp. ES6]
MPDQARPRQDDRPAIIWVVVAIVVGGALTVAGVVTGSLASTTGGVVVLFICSTATRIWYLRQRR